MVGRSTSFLLSGQNSKIMSVPITNRIIHQDVQNLKISIMNSAVLPLFSKQWKILRENMFNIDKLKKKLDAYYNAYKFDELIIFKNLLDVIEIMIFEHIQIEDMEKKLYSKSNNDSTMVYTTAMLRLKPEYELYDMILGKPNKNKKESSQSGSSDNPDHYYKPIIDEIVGLLKIENINFAQIKTTIRTNFPDFHYIE